AVPWFWSDQYDLTIQVAGLPDEAARVVARPLADGVDLNLHLAADGRLVAASAFGPNGLIGREVRLAEMLIARAARPDPDALASPQVRLKSLLA
ncbi:oxidoreductase C-terminal domain-containing protein, partial [Nostoc sp. NIES-2111]